MSKGVIARADAGQFVVQYQPRELNRMELSPVGSFVNIHKGRAEDFQVAEAVRTHTGLAAQENERIELKVEEEALSKLKEIQEGAYKQAYALGLQEGKAEAFQQASQQISEKLEELHALVESIRELKPDLVAFNEAHIVKTIYLFASKIAMFEIEQKAEHAVVEVLKNAMKLSQDDEKIVIKVSPLQVDFLEQLKQETGRDFDFLKHVEFKPDPQVQSGGCVITTNYGEIDAKIEERVAQLWEALKDAVPQIKDAV